MKTIPVSNLHIQKVIHPVRTEAQREIVMKIAESPEFDFACGNPLRKEVGDFTGTFCFLYYTKNKRIHSARISPTGKVTKNYEA